MRLVFVADLIPPELERVVEFLNRNMPSVDVVALEVKQFVGGVQTTLVSRLLGQSAATRQTKSVTRGKRRWDEDSFFAHASEVCDAEDVDVMRDLYAWCRERSLRFAWGTGSREGTFFPCLDIGGHSYWPYRLRSNGVVEFQFYWMARREPFIDDALRDQFRLKLNEIDGVEFAPASIAKQPSFPVSRVRNLEQRRRFDDAIEWFFDAARHANSEGPA
jgi:hypothetical protein